MTKAFVVVDLGFGDSGKGLVVDFLASRYTYPPLVVRYCGGHQSAHHVVTPDERTHRFSQVGSGAFHGCTTYIGPDFIFSPTKLVEEINSLEALGVSVPMIHVDYQALVTTPYHILANQAVESKQRHGSCGWGIGKTREYWLRHGQDAIFVGDFIYHRSVVCAKLRLMRQRFLDSLYNDYRETVEWKKIYELNPLDVYDSLNIDHSLIKYVMNFDTHAHSDIVIFEGSQGVLLDENFGCYRPNVTWSTTTDFHAREICRRDGIDDIETIGVTRTYHTRHGAGNLPNELPLESLINREKHNKSGGWQGRWRVSKLNQNLLEHAISKLIDNNPSLFVTHCDNSETIGVNTKDGWTPIRDIAKYLNDCIAPVKYCSYGPTYKDVKKYGK